MPYRQVQPRSNISGGGGGAGNHECQPKIGYPEVFVRFVRLQLLPLGSVPRTHDDLHILNDAT